MRQGGRIAGVSRPKEKGFHNYENPIFEPLDTTQDAAALVNVSHGSVTRAAKLAQEAPDLAEKVKQGGKRGGCTIIRYIVTVNGCHSTCVWVTLCVSRMSLGRPRLPPHQGLERLLHVAAQRRPWGPVPLGT